MKNKVLFLLDKNNSWSHKFIESHIKNLKDKFKSQHIFFLSKSVPRKKKYDITFFMNLSHKVNLQQYSNLGLKLLVHESDLPKGKGFSPIQWQILKNKKKITFCLIKAEDKLDSGAIILRDNLYLNGDELNDEIREKQFGLQMSLIENFLLSYPKYNMKKQTGTSSIFRKRDLRDSKININENIKNQFNLLRIVDNERWPAYFSFKKNFYKLKIYKLMPEEIGKLKIMNIKKNNKNKKINLKRK